MPDASFWLWHAGASVITAALVMLLAPRLHRLLKLPQASRGYWLGAWLLAVVPTPLALLLPWLAPDAVPAPLPLLLPLSELPSSWIDDVGSGTPHDGFPYALLPALVYVAGIGLVAVRWLMGLRALRAVLRDAEVIGITQWPGSASREAGLRLQHAGVRVLMVDAAVSPFALRWPRRLIVLPRALLSRLDDMQLNLVLRHEAAHLYRHDAQWNLLLRLGGGLLWFNPLLRVLARRVGLAAELACDAAALGAQKNMRRAYAEAYLETLRMSMNRTLPCQAIAFSPQDQGSHRMRLKHIVNGDPQARKRPLRVALVAALALVGGGGIAALQASPQTRTPVQLSGPIIEGRISSGFGTVRKGISTQPHRGIDLTAARGTKVRAPAAGKVQVATELYEAGPRYGSVIVLDHGDGWQTLYAHLDRIDVAVGDDVAAGDTIGLLGSTGQATGPHVHVEVLHNGTRVDPASVIAEPVAAR